MKPKKFKGVKLYPAKLGMPFNKGEKMNTISNSNTIPKLGVQTPPVEKLGAPPKEQKRKRKGRGLDFTQQENEYIYGCAAEIIKKTGAATLTINDLASIASKCNLAFHNKIKQRTPEGLWWHIRREITKQEESGAGDPYMCAIPISKGSPKYRKTVTGEISSARKPILPLAAPPVLKKQPPVLNKPKVSEGCIEIVARDPATGKMEKFQTKFNNLEELMFAVS